MRQISNIFGLELYRADSIHGRKKIDESCEECKHFKALNDSCALMGPLTGAILEHIFFEHNAKQKEPLHEKHEYFPQHATCQDCGRNMEEVGYGGWATHWRCMSCGFEWVLQRGLRFDPAETRKREKEWRKKHKNVCRRRRWSGRRRR